MQKKYYQILFLKVLKKNQKTFSFSKIEKSEIFRFCLLEYFPFSENISQISIFQISISQISKRQNRNFSDFSISEKKIFRGNIFSKIFFSSKIFELENFSNINIDVKFYRESISGI